ncbi:MAG: hypothetical protein V4650_09955 [Pseudomonadota bacterium]
MGFKPLVAVAEHGIAEHRRDATQAQQQKQHIVHRASSTSFFDGAIGRLQGVKIRVGDGGSGVKIP